ncbi:MAG: DUF2797 domain-containing protein [Bacteroidetes bacterium]|nr:MAG: DUF2797 domain-containing protein [Bacteroidota bacterium]
MTYAGNLKKMTVAQGEPIAYSLALGEDRIDMTTRIGQPLRLHFTGQINCKICGRKIKKAFGEGLCYPDFMNHPANSPCIIRPELCAGHLGQGRDPEWEKTHHVQPHVVYLALSSAVKVGVTRADQVPTRWIDQGASAAIIIAETPYRQLAGLIEVAIKDHLTDKTPWQKMLKNEVAEGVDLVAEKQQALEFLPADLHAFASAKDQIWTFAYPVQAFPDKVKSLNLDKTPTVEGILLGIKGQYLIFDDNRVMNIRRHTGYWVEMD